MVITTNLTLAGAELTQDAQPCVINYATRCRQQWRRVISVRFTILSPSVDNDVDAVAL